MRRYFIILLGMVLAGTVVLAGPVRDDDDKTPAWRQSIRRLHPERERAKAMKKLQEEMSRHTNQTADPWDTADQVWGEVDVPTDALRDSTAAEGHLLTPGETAVPRRLRWHDDPVLVGWDQLQDFLVIDDGEYRSKYVSPDATTDEAYFAFAVTDSVVGPLRLCLRYCGNRPLHYDQVVFTIDGFDYMFYPFDTLVERLDDGRSLERSDDVLRAGYKDLVYALAHGHWVMMKLCGDGGVNHVKMLSDGQIDDFAHTLALYRLMGGTFLDKR